MVASVDGFYIGIGIGVAVVLLVVVLVCMILTFAHKISQQALTGIGAMDVVRENTDGDWRLQDINRSATGIWKAAEAARKALGG